MRGSAGLGLAKERQRVEKHSSGEVERRTVKNCIGQAEFCFWDVKSSEGFAGQCVSPQRNGKAETGVALKWSGWEMFRIVKAKY